jgi:serine protease Do
LGIETQALTDALAASFGLPALRGVLVTRVQPGSAASRAGIRTGDVVLEYASRSVETPEELARAVEQTQPGTRAQLALWRSRGQIAATVVLDRAEAPAGSLVTSAPDELAFGDGLRLVAAPYEQCQWLNIAFGLVVQESAAAQRIGLEPGDVIMAVNEHGFDTRQDFDRLLVERMRRAAPLALLVRRDGRSLYVPLAAGQH